MEIRRSVIARPNLSTRRTSQSSSYLRCREPSRLSRPYCFLDPAGWGYDQGQCDGNQHHPRDHMQGSTIHTIRLTHMGNEQRSKCAREAPCSQHESVNGAHIVRAKVISRKRRHRAESPAVTHKDDKGDEREHRSRVDVRKYPKECGLPQKHHHECCASGDRIGCPRPKHPPERIPDASHSDHAGSNSSAYSGKLLEQWRFL